MAKYMVEAISMFRMRYVIDAKNADHAMDEVTMNDNGDLREFSQKHIAENITSVRQIDDQEYLRMFDEDNDYLAGWDENSKFNWVNVINYDETE